jgi:hypothetical protein
MRPSDEEYYLDHRTEHVAQGDIFREIPFHHPVRPEEIVFAGYAMLLNYTSSMLQGVEGTNREYRHHFRVVAPIFELAHIHEHDPRWTEQKIEQLRVADDFGGWMYLPAYPDEFREGAVALFRPALALQDQLEGRRVTQLQFEAERCLCLKLAKVFAGIDAEPGDVNPDMRDHWEGA